MAPSRGHSALSGVLSWAPGSPAVRRMRLAQVALVTWAHRLELWVLHQGGD